ncbi:MAG: DcrB-related protein [Geobacteraceae bacterium]|nr:DcrB-related protein [Geobacteraceae bacterium]
MPQHYTNELIFDLPESLIDKTHHIFTLTEEGPSEFNLVINHHEIEQDESLQNYGSKLTAEMETSLPRYQLHASGDMKVAGQDALWPIYSWVQNNQKLHQAQVNFFLDKEQGKRQVIQITATTLGGFTDEWKQTFETFLSSVKLRQNPHVVREQ